MLFIIQCKYKISYLILPYTTDIYSSTKVLQVTHYEF